MQLSVIILNYNVCDFLYLCLQSVQESIQGLEAEIIVIDNASSDDSCQMVKTCFSEVSLIENKKNVGFAVANNQAVAVAKGEYVCILNPDTVVTGNTFVNVLQKANTIPNLGILGVQLIDGKGNFLPESKRNLPTPLVSICKMLGGKYAFKAPYYSDHIKQDNEGETQILVGAFMFLKTSIYKEVGGFDEDYFMYGEDIDLSYKIEKKGYKNYYYGLEKVIHFKGESTFKDEKYRKRFFGAMKLFYQKHFKSSFLVNGFIYLGIKFSSLLQARKVKDLPLVFKKAVVISNNQLLVNKIQEKTGIPTVLNNVNQAYGNSIVKEPTICFLDMNKISYSEAILLISSNMSSGFYFRFIPRKYKRAIGSDSSKGRGQVISLE